MAQHGVQPNTGSHERVATIAQDELLDMKRALTLLHAEMHNPGAARHIAQDVDLDKLTEEMVYIIDHCLENLSS